jgi:DNA-directed RNA polymerase specialized sigma24 family protein
MTAASIAHAIGATPSAVESALRRLFARLRGKVEV